MNRIIFTSQIIYKLNLKSKKRNAHEYNDHYNILMKKMEKISTKYLVTLA